MNAITKLKMGMLTAILLVVNVNAGKSSPTRWNKRLSKTHFEISENSARTFLFYIVFLTIFFMGSMIFRMLNSL
jgi:hypothetical protein